MSRPSVEILIHPVTIRFRLHDDELVYFFSAHPDQQLDGMEQMFGVGPDGDEPIFQTNVGFLPTASTVLIRGEKNIIVDPGNAHIGNYGMIYHALRKRGMTMAEIDAVALTHGHSDHAAALLQFKGKPWYVGKGELAEMAALEGEPIIAAKRQMMGELTEVDGSAEIMPGVTAYQTPGHTAGHISFLVETEQGKVLIAGDQAMTRSEYVERKFSQWYGPDALAQLNASLDLVQSLDPDLVIPGHDRPFKP